MKTLFDTETPPTQGEMADSAVAAMKAADEALLTAVVERMTVDEGFRRDVLREASRLGQGRKGAHLPEHTKAAAIRLARTALLWGNTAPEVLDLLERTFNLTRRQSKPLFNVAMATTPGRRVHRIGR